MAKEWGYASHNGEWSQGITELPLAFHRCAGKRGCRGS